MRSRLSVLRRPLSVVLMMVALQGATPIGYVEPPDKATLTDAFAVVVDPSNPVSDLSLSELRRLFSGEKTFWPDGRRVVLLLPASGTPARKVVLNRIYEMGDGELKRFWISKTFRDEATVGPKIVSTAALAKRLLAEIPGAIAVIPASEVGDGVRLVTIDGRRPGADGYPLAEHGR